MPTHLKDLDAIYRKRRSEFRKYVINTVRFCECKPYCREHGRLHLHEWYIDGNEMQGWDDWVYDKFLCHPANVMLLGENIHLSTRDKPSRSDCRIAIYRRDPSFFWPYGFSNGQEALEHLFKLADSLHEAGIIKHKIAKL